MSSLPSPASDTQRSAPYAERFKARYQELRQDPFPLDLDSELAVARAALDLCLEDIDEESDYTPATAQRLVNLVSDVSKMVERIHRIRESRTFTASELEYAIHTMETLFLEFVPANRLDEALNRLHSQLIDPNNVVVRSMVMADPEVPVVNVDLGSPVPEGALVSELSEGESEISETGRSEGSSRYGSASLDLREAPGSNLEDFS